MIKSKKKMWKKAICLIFAFLLSINGFAAVVSDNDGSAFITKAEFDSLKNDFQSQLDSYNTSIDQKIDEAITSYLTGLQIKRNIDLDSLLNKVNAASGYTTGWFPMCKTFTFTTTKKPVNGQLALNVVHCRHSGQTAYNNWRGSHAYSMNLNHSSGTVRDTLQYVDIPSTKTNGVYYSYKHNDAGNFNYYNKMYYTVSYKELLTGVSFGWVNTNSCANSITPDWSIDTCKNESNIWTAQNKTAHCVVPLYNYSPAGTSLDVSVACLWIPSYELTTTAQIWPIMGSCPTTSDKYFLKNDNTVKMTTSDTMSTYAMGYKGMCLTVENTDIKISSAATGSLSNLNFYYNYHPYETGKITDLGVGEIADILDNEKHGFYSGLPICKINDDGILTMELKFHSNTGNKILWALKSKPFDNDSTYVNDASLNIRGVDGSSIITQEVNNNASLRLKCDVKKGTVLWVKTYDVGDATKYTGVETVELKEEIE